MPQPYPPGRYSPNRICSAARRRVCPPSVYPLRLGLQEVLSKAGAGRPPRRPRRTPGRETPARPRLLHNWDDVTAGGSGGAGAGTPRARGCGTLRAARAPPCPSSAAPRGSLGGCASTASSAARRPRLQRSGSRASERARGWTGTRPRLLRDLAGLSDSGARRLAAAG